jgi:hypothetical protein
MDYMIDELLSAGCLNQEETIKVIKIDRKLKKSNSDEYFISRTYRKYFNF